MISQVIAVIGHLAMDMTFVTPRIPQPRETVKARRYIQGPGGKGANAAVAAFRSSHNKIRDDGPFNGRFVSAFDDLDIKVCMIGAVGEDAHAARLLENLNRNGIDARGVMPVPGGTTGVCVCTVEPGASNRMLGFHGASDQITPERFRTPEHLGYDIKPDLIVSQFELRKDVVEHVLKLASEANIEVLLNAAPGRYMDFELYAHVTHLIVNDVETATCLGEEAHTLDRSMETWQRFAQSFLAEGVDNVVITLGKEGVYYATRQGSHGLIEAERARRVDSTGAGSAFVGAYATEYLRQKVRNEWDIRLAIQRAMRAAALTIRELGAQDAMPWAEDIDHFVLDSASESMSRTSVDT